MAIFTSADIDYANANNCECSINGNVLQSAKKYMAYMGTWEVKPKSGYVFDNEQYTEFISGYPVVFKVVDGKISGGKGDNTPTSLERIGIATIAGGSGVVEKFISSEDIAKLTEKNLVAYIDGVEVIEPKELGDYDEIQFKCLDGWQFIDEYYGGSMNGYYVTVAVAENKTETIATTLNRIPESVDFFAFTTEEIPVPKDVFLTQNDLDIANSGRYFVYVNDSKIEVPTEVKVNDLLMFRAFDGYSFVGSEFNTIGYFGNGYAIDFDINADRTQAEKVIKVLPKSLDKFYGLETTAIKPDIMGEVNHLYMVDKENLRALNEKRFYEIVPDGNSLHSFDYSKFIINLLMFPFTLPDDIKSGVEKIRLANFTIDTEATTLNKDNIYIDMGVISVPKPDNYLGMNENVTTVLYLPFSNSIILDSEMVLGHDIKISLVLNAYTGLATYDVFSSLINDSIHNFTLNLGINIPFANTAGEKELFLSSDLQTGGDNFIRNAFIEVMDRNNDDLNNGMFNVSVKEYGNISNQSGFIRVEDLEMTMPIMIDELQMIKDKLNEGVFV